MNTEQLYMSADGISTVLDITIRLLENLVCKQDRIIMNANWNTEIRAAAIKLLTVRNEIMQEQAELKQIRKDRKNTR